MNWSILINWRANPLMTQCDNWSAYLYYIHICEIRSPPQQINLDQEDVLSNFLSISNDLCQN